MTTLPLDAASDRPSSDRRRTALLALLGAQVLALNTLLPYHAFVRQDALGPRAATLVVTPFALWALYAAWRRLPAAPWLVLATAGLKLTVDLYNGALGLDTRLLPVSMIADVVIVWLAFGLGPPAREAPYRADRIYFGAVLALAALIGVWGLVNPAGVALALPLDVPPLHARFLGSMYLSGATFMLLAIRARRWSQLRFVVPMAATWTGLLGVVSLVHLEVFDWRRLQAWVWWAAYIVFPILGAWIAWRQRGLNPDEPGGWPGSRRAGFLTIGAVSGVLAVALLVAPGAMVAAWPWAISPVLAQIYGAPFAAYALGGLLCARRPGSEAVRIVVASTAVFTLCVLAASLLHRGLFAPAASATWLWFGGFAAASAFLVADLAADSNRSGHTGEAPGA